MYSFQSPSGRSFCFPSFRVPVPRRREKEKEKDRPARSMILDLEDIIEDSLIDDDDVERASLGRGGIRGDGRVFRC